MRVLKFRRFCRSVLFEVFQNAASTGYNGHFLLQSTCNLSTPKRPTFSSPFSYLLFTVLTEFGGTNHICFQGMYAPIAYSRASEYAEELDSKALPNYAAAFGTAWSPRPPLLFWLELQPMTVMNALSAKLTPARLICRKHVLSLGRVSLKIPALYPPGYSPQRNADPASDQCQHGTTRAVSVSSAQSPLKNWSLHPRDDWTSTSADDSNPLSFRSASSKPSLGRHGNNLSFHNSSCQPFSPMLRKARPQRSTISKRIFNVRLALPNRQAISHKARSQHLQFY